MITRAVACLPLLAALGCAGAAEFDPARGALLYENFCRHCHLAEIHLRVHSHAHSWPELLRLVDMWQAEMDLDWTEEDVRDVAGWLDWRFYHLADAPGPR